MRTSEAVGTLSFDIVRALRFSRLNYPASREASVAWKGPGYPNGVDTGFTAVGVYATEPWIDSLKFSISNNRPVIVLQQYAYDDPGGHYRVVYGYNDTHLMTKDPWGR